MPLERNSKRTYLLKSIREGEDSLLYFVYVTIVSVISYFHISNKIRKVFENLLGKMFFK